MQNEYAHKQRFKHSYFQYKKDDHSTSSPGRHEDTTSHRKRPKQQHNLPAYEERTGKHGILKPHFSSDDHVEPPHRERTPSPTPTHVSILPGEHESPADKERKKQQLAAELRAQMAMNEQKKRREKESKKNSDYKYLYESIHDNPFGRMGAGAPLRDPEGHIIAHRLKMYDEAEATSFHKSFYRKPEESHKTQEQDVGIRRKEEIQNLNEAEIGLQFLEWSNQERRRKEQQRAEWKKTLDEQSNLIKRKKDEDKRSKLQEDLRLEEKIKKDLEELNEEYERETGRRANKYASFTAGKESSVNYVVQNKRKSRRNSEYKRSQNHTPSRDRSGSYDRMRDFKGLDEEEDDTRSNYLDYNGNRNMHNRGYENDANIRSLREDLRKREGSLGHQLQHMKEKRSQQQQEIKNTLDSLMQLQMELERKNRDRKIDNSDFYNSLATENKALLGSLRSNRRNNLNTSHTASRVYSQNARPNNLTPYEQRYGFANSSNYNASIRHESVFLNAEAPQYTSHQKTNEVLDDLLNSYGNGSLGQGYQDGRFTLPVPKTSMSNYNHQDSRGQYQPNVDQPYDDQIINVDENIYDHITPEDSLDKLVDDAESVQRAAQEVA